MSEVANLRETKSVRQEILTSRPLDNEIAELKAAIERYMDFDHRDVNLQRHPRGSQALKE